MRLIEIEKAARESCLSWKSILTNRSIQRTSNSEYMGFQVFFARTKKLGKPYAYQRNCSIT